VLINCRHEIPLTCASVNFKIATTKTDATVNIANGKISVTATGGYDFKYSLNGGAFTSNGDFTGLAAGSVNKIIGKNNLGCIDSATVTLGNIDPCAGVTIAVTTVKVDATAGLSNGSITATAIGATAFTYSINGGAFQASPIFSNLPMGNYTVAAKSAAGCIGLSTQVAIGNVDPCAGVTVVVTSTQVQPVGAAANGSITASATGGTVFTYSINGGAFQASNTFANLVAGNYTITAKNANGCTGVLTVALGASNPCAGVTVVVTSTNIQPTGTASNGSIAAAATGGTGFTYSLNGGVYQASGTFGSLAAGTYTITAKNANGCLGSLSVTLTAVSPCAGISIVINHTLVNATPCVTPAANGSITASATGSTGFTYNINGGAYQASGLFAALSPASYVVGAKDVNGCINTKSVTVGLVAAGPNFAQVRPLITTRCSGSGCHMNGSAAANYNFDADCSIVTNWDQINKTCVLYTVGWIKMPKAPQPFFTAAEKLIITNWVNAGHKYTD
jgi:SprB repeat